MKVETLEMITVTCGETILLDEISKMLKAIKNLAPNKDLVDVSTGQCFTPSCVSECIDLLESLQNNHIEIY